MHAISISKLSKGKRIPHAQAQALQRIKATKSVQIKLIQYQVIFPL